MFCNDLRLFLLFTYHPIITKMIVFEVLMVLPLLVSHS